MLKEDHYQGYCQSILDATEMGLRGRFDDSSTAAMIGTINGSSKINHPAAIGKDKVKGVAQLAVRRVPISPYISNLSAISHPKPRAIEKSQLTGAYATLPVAYGTPQNPSR